jgi:hypothetical protein
VCRGSEVVAPALVADGGHAEIALRARRFT